MMSRASIPEQIGLRQHGWLRAHSTTTMPPMSLGGEGFSHRLNTDRSLTIIITCYTEAIILYGLPVTVKQCHKWQRHLFCKYCLCFLLPGDTQGTQSPASSSSLVGQFI